jgi:hypothetical protein
MVEQLPQLGRLQRPNLWSFTGLQPGEPRRVRCDQSLALGVGQGGPQRRAYPLLGCRAHRAGVGLRPLGVDRGEHRFDVSAAQERDLDPSKVRGEVVGDVLPAGVQGGRPDVTLPGQPFGQVRSDGEPAGDVDTPGGLASRGIERGERSLLGGEPAPAENATVPVGVRFQLDAEEPAPVTGVPGAVGAAHLRTLRAKLDTVTPAPAPLVRRPLHL